MYIAKWFHTPKYLLVGRGSRPVSLVGHDPRTHPQASYYSQVFPPRYDLLDFPNRRVVPTQIAAARIWRFLCPRKSAPRPVAPPPRCRCRSSNSVQFSKWPFRLKFQTHSIFYVYLRDCIRFLSPFPFSGDMPYGANAETSEYAEYIIEKWHFRFNKHREKFHLPRSFVLNARGSGGARGVCVWRRKGLRFVGCE